MINYHDLFSFIGGDDIDPACKDNQDLYLHFCDELCHIVKQAIEISPLGKEIQARLDACNKIWAADRPVKYCEQCAKVLPQSKFYFDDDVVCCFCAPDPELDRYEREARLSEDPSDAYKRSIEK